ncbi:MAG TPA: nuclear transport factor 2 family protein [Flavisolibacter sp.]|nr:nuclear transport factor 2 family protein [Flavisolibacter sp.]
MIRKAYKPGLFAILTFAASAVMAQSDESAVQQTINRLFEGMKKTDTALIRSVFAPGAILQTVDRGKDGKVTIKSAPLDSFLVSVARPRTEVLDERIRFETVRTDGDLATAWTPYQFYFGQNFSHCGANSFQLVKLNGEWKIQYLIDTRRRKDCQ